MVGSLVDTDIKLGKPRLSPHTILRCDGGARPSITQPSNEQGEASRPVNAGIRIGNPKISTYLGDC